MSFKRFTCVSLVLALTLAYNLQMERFNSHRFVLQYYGLDDP